MRKGQYKIVSLTALGGALEFYDFTIYALFAPYISAHFFSNPNQLVSLMNTFLVFALGYLARPLGGIVFGHFGDKFGRKSAFSASVFLMAIATLLMGCLPDYQSIGNLAPLCLIGLRLLQGFSVGGEIPGAAVFTLEHVPCHKQGFSMGLVFMSITLGNSLGALVGFLLTYFLTKAQMMSWGWRVPFLIGFVLGIISFVIRKRSFETPAFLALYRAGKMERRPLLTLWASSKKQLLKGFILTAISASIVSFFLYLPTYLLQTLHLEPARLYLFNLMTFTCFAFATAFWGWYSDKVNRNLFIRNAALLLLVAIYPLFYGLTTIGVTFVWLFCISVAMIAGMINGSYVALIASLFPTSTRYSGVGFSYSLGFSLFGGIAPFAFTWLISFTKLYEAPAFYLLGCAALTFAACTGKRLNLAEKKELLLTCD